MRRIDDPSAAVALPVPEAAGAEGFFTEGNPGVTPATLVRASWLNMIQEELRAIVVAAGLAPSKTSYNQVLTALSSTGVFQTPTQFDNSTRVATTASVKAAGMQHSAPFGVSVTSTLTAAQAVGNFILLTPVAPITVTLPTATTCPAGGAISFLNASSFNVTISRGGTDGINIGSGTAVNTVVLTPGDTLSLTNPTSFTAANWQVFGGAGQLGATASFASILGANGYQKLPTGFIIQWGNVASSGAADVPVTFPVAFTSAVYSVTANISSSAVGYVASTNGFSTSGFNLGTYSSSSTRAPATTYWIAVGK